MPLEVQGLSVVHYSTGTEECWAMNGRWVLILLNLAHYQNRDVTREMGAIGTDIRQTPVRVPILCVVSIHGRGVPRFKIART